MNKLAKIITAICVVAFVFYSEVLKLIYPNASEDYAEFVQYYYTKIRFDETMFMLLFFVVFLLSSRWIRAISLFGFVVTFGSVADKIIFGFNDYLYTDIILIIVGLRLAWLVRKK